jgi:NADH:ubiquinone oxidoreductase subunit C
MSEAPAPTLRKVQAEEIAVESLLERIQQFKAQKLRFMSTTCLDKDDHFDVYYHFDNNMKFVNLLVHVDKGDPIPSISSIYFCAFLPENEMKDLFGINVEGLNIDYGGNFLLTEKYDRPPLLKDPKSEGV